MMLDYCDDCGDSREVLPESSTILVMMTMILGKGWDINYSKMTWGGKSGVS